MKWLSIFLALNILCSTNGIALYEHLCKTHECSIIDSCCSKKEADTNQQSDNEVEDDDCCYSNFLDFEKLKVESNRLSDLSEVATIADIPIELHWLATTSAASNQTVLKLPKIRPPTQLAPKLENSLTFLQVFLC